MMQNVLDKLTFSYNNSANNIFCHQNNNGEDNIDYRQLWFL